MKLAPLPEAVEVLLDERSAPARLRAHLSLVHDVAILILTAIEKFGVVVDRDALFGAATHDIGKVVHPKELSEPGNAHEVAGRELLLAHGYSEQQARFAVTHASPETLEDLIVALADKLWKGKRVEAYEERIARAIASKQQRDFWEVYPVLMEAFDAIAQDADRRLEWQNRHLADSSRCNRSGLEPW